MKLEKHVIVKLNDGPWAAQNSVAQADALVRNHMEQKNFRTAIVSVLCGAFLYQSLFGRMEDGSIGRYRRIRNYNEINE